MRFTYIDDTGSNVIRALHAISVPREMRSPLAAVMTMLIVLTTWFFYEQHLVRVAVREDAAALRGVRLARSALAARRLERVDLERLVRLDTSIRSVRATGIRIANHLARLGNALPADAWVTSIASDERGVTIDGRALRFVTLPSLMVAAMDASPGASTVRLMQVTRLGNARAIVYEVRVDE